MSVTPGTYMFTYEGNGNAADTDTFTVGTNVIHSGDLIGTSFTYTVGVTGDVPFTYENVTTGHRSCTAPSIRPIHYPTEFFRASTAACVYRSQRSRLAGRPRLPGYGHKGFGCSGVSTWAMMLLGFLGIGYAGYRGRKDRRRPR